MPSSIAKRVRSKIHLILNISTNFEFEIKNNRLNTSTDKGNINLYIKNYLNIYHSISKGNLQHFSKDSCNFSGKCLINKSFSM